MASPFRFEKLEKADMKRNLKQLALACSLLLVGTAAMAKLPAPSDEAKAKAAEAAAKWTGTSSASRKTRQQRTITRRPSPQAKRPSLRPACRLALTPAPSSIPLQSLHRLLRVQHQWQRLQLRQRRPNLPRNPELPALPDPGFRTSGA